MRLKSQAELQPLRPLYADIVFRKKDGTVTARIPGVWCARAGCYVSIPTKE